ncbi:MAG TPA: carboxypeptidase regulatory-like domain-containing protein, partial [Thermoanaerobaculia bacterium]|nr:carboxypeptidase regulatory-like domain-containing protein [Thermoanaerobaculia bacterium]
MTRLAPGRRIPSRASSFRGSRARRASESSGGRWVADGWEGGPTRTRRGNARTAVAALLLILACATRARSQTTGGIQGWIVDSSNVPLPGVSVEVTGASLQGRRAAVTGRDGTYRLPGLPPGPYKLSAELPGFASVEKMVDVLLDATTSVKLILQLSLQEQVVVTATESQAEIDTSSTTTGTTYRCGVVVHLPVDRDYADIVKANPGVATDLGSTQGRSLALTVNGSTSAENGWVIDGINTVNVLKGIQGKAINAEFIQEIEVKTGGYQAEYGRSMGGVINVITKSGSNTLHGDG